MKKTINQERIEGRLYQHNLVIKQVQNKESANYGKDFISGTIDVATDEDGLNVIQVHFTYVTEITNNGKTNVTYGVLKSIIDGAKTWIEDGKDAALKVRVNTALGLNDFYNDRDELVSAKRNEGGFVNIVKDLAPEEERNTFKTDMLITSVVRVDADEENNIPEDYLKIRGAVFNFRNDILPVEFTCHYEKAFAYFEGLDASNKNPIFTEVRGKIINTTIEKKIEEESAFGTVSVRTVPRTSREWAIDWARPVEYDLDEETLEDIKKAMQDREVYLAGVKKRRDEYLASKENTTSNVASNSETEEENPSIPEGGFNF